MRYSKVNKISISIDFIRGAIKKVPLNESEVDTLLYSCRIPRALLKQPQARVSLLQYSRFITALMRACDDELLGQAYQSLPIGSLSILAHWLVAAKTMGQVVHRLERYYQIMGKGMDISIDEDADSFSIEIGNAYHAVESNVFINEFSFFSIHRILCWLQKDIFPIQHLYFPFEAPDYAKDYRLMFYGAPVSFESKHARIVFSRKLLDKPVLQNQDSLERLLADPIGNFLVLNFYGESWSSKVGSMIQDQLHALPTLPELAATMNVQPYTLQRRLAEEGVNYLAIKNQMKRDGAIERLVHTDLTIEEISSQLGFSETSPFTRTFKEWTGVPPSAYRKKQ